ncbi:MarR family winged helix-turn-helix transcriptional regulator [Arenibaculum pallidiluteum]|uniref:MarR family winged helix-turn-helix transcriptional regulator n=1 Tax=Arenibaculum pallidiluteum TaxID=2812559 RepID=UPI001F243385|nr:MarR family transcriptional regulator [Arenibaculum pallidiluteum]
MMAEGAIPSDYETAAERHEPELRLWLRLLTCTSMVEGEVRGRLRDRFSVTLPRFDMMAALDRAPEGLTMGALSRRLMVSNGNVTGVADRLVAEGLVSREAAPGDRRSAVIRLTPRGRQAFAEMARAHEAWIAGFFSGLDADEIAQLMDLLGRAKRSVRASLRREETP